MATLIAFVLAVGSIVSAQLLYDPQQVVQPASQTVKDPLTYLGGNSPWFAGPEGNGVSNDIPDGCVVEKASYTLRHGSRYPDNGAYQEWLALYYKIQNASSIQASGALSFLPEWKPVLTSPSSQISQLSITGYKEAHDLGYALRQRYPDFYTSNDTFPVWSNDYPRVIQTAQSFVHGYLGPSSSELAYIIAVNSTGDPSAFGNSLAPSDLCPAFKDVSSNETKAWENVYLPPITKRLNGLFEGLKFNDTDVDIMPYLCGFESQITGRLSPWCDVFTREELEGYQYEQDLRYWYGVGPGAPVGRLMMLPYLRSVVDLLACDSGVNGTTVEGGGFVLPKLLMAFANDGQIAELVAGLGVFDNQKPSDPLKKDCERRYISSRFVSMRGTVALEKMRCRVDAGESEVFLRILLNDAVFPVSSCQSGPGKSCKLSEYQEVLARKYEEGGGFWQVCNVTDVAFPKLVGGASFFTDLTLPYLRSVKP